VFWQVTACSGNSAIPLCIQCITVKKRLAMFAYVLPQLRTENPRVGGSNPPLGTIKIKDLGLRPAPEIAA
jgi:hypothetical protein